MKAVAFCLLFTAFLVCDVSGAKVGAVIPLIVNINFVFVLRQMSRSCKTKSTSFPGSLEVSLSSSA